MRYYVTASWWITAESEEDAINLVEDAVASKVSDSELDDSNAEPEECGFDGGGM